MRIAKNFRTDQETILHFLDILGGGLTVLAPAVLNGGSFIT